MWNRFAGYPFGGFLRDHDTYARIPTLQRLCFVGPIDGQNFESQGLPGFDIGALKRFVAARHKAGRKNHGSRGGVRHGGVCQFNWMYEGRV